MDFKLIVTLAVLCGLLLSSVVLAARVINGESGRWIFGIWLALATTMVASLYFVLQGDGDVEGIYKSAFVVVPAFAVILLLITGLAIIANRPSNWRRAEEQCREYAGEGKRPCIAHGLLRKPQAMPDTPDGVRTGFSMLAENGRVVKAYSTISWSAYEDATDPYR